jgi:hypothetical protein
MFRQKGYDDMMCASGLVLLDAFIQEYGADHELVRGLPVVRLLNAQSGKN